MQNIAPEPVRGGKYRFVRTAPVLFSPLDPKTLYYAGNILLKTRDGGHSWQEISPDLTRESWDIPASVGIYSSESMKKMPRRGVIYTVAPSPRDINTIWAGTDDGLIQVTRDGGKTWKNVTPAQVNSWSKISIMDASHFDVNTAYAAVNRIRLDDMHPHIYKTADGGKSWQEIVGGLPDDPINVIREDPYRKGLLYAGSERSVYVSFDDGGHWQSLRLNMPATSIRDLVIKDDDIVVGTHGRGFWILDAVTALREVTPGSGTILYKPAKTYRVRYNMGTDTPLPQEEPAGQNPPEGAIIDYYISNKPSSPVTLEILDQAGKLIRKYSSTDTFYTIPPVNIPLYWIRPQQILSAEPGAHRFTWDLHYTPLNIPASYPIGATFGNTAPVPSSPWALPGEYTIRLTVNGKSYLQRLVLEMDPRVKATAADLQLQHDLSKQCYEARLELMKMSADISQARSELAASGDSSAKKLDLLAAALLHQPRGSREPGLDRLSNLFGSLFGILHETEMSPTTQVITGVREASGQLDELSQAWETLKTKIDAIGK